MKYFVELCAREKNTDHIKIHVGTNILNSETNPERISKSIVDVARNIKTKKSCMGLYHATTT